MQNVKTITFVQSTPSSLWHIEHQLNNPNVIVETIIIDENGEVKQVFPSKVVRIDSNTIDVYFTSPHAGEARIVG
jgi:hypothetical protein